MRKVNYSNFNDKEVVSSLQRSLYLDESQFEGLPSKKVTLKTVKVSKFDANKPNTIDNIKYYKFAAIDVEKINAVKKASAALDASMKAIVEQMIANIPRVYFKVVIDGGKADNAQNLFDFITSNNLDDNVNDVVLSNLKWHVTWAYEDAYHDVLTLVVDNFDKVTVTAGKE